jgi:hypothetical protein
MDLTLSSEGFAGIEVDFPYKLGLGCYCAGQDLVANLFYRADLFSTQAIDRLARDLSSLLNTTT